MKLELCKTELFGASVPVVQATNKVDHKRNFTSSPSPFFKVRCQVFLIMDSLDTILVTVKILIILEILNVIILVIIIINQRPIL